MERRCRNHETHEQGVHRLAHVGAERGVRVYVYPPTGEHYATSASTPGLLHRVTLVSCDCPGFFRNQRCTHHSALLAELGQLPPLPEPPSAAAMVERHAVRVEQWHVNNEAHARRWLESLIARQERGETVPERDLLEATKWVATYAAITGSNQQPVALAA